MPDEKARNLINTGSELAGAAIGGALGFLAGGPIPAAGAAAVGVVVTKAAAKVITDVAHRFLSKREEVRVGAAAAFALDQSRKLLEAGHAPREDGFFDKQGGGRSHAEEIFEGVLLKSKNEHQEKKVKILGSFFGNVAFLPGVSVGEANYALNLAERFTYRQMCSLALLDRKPRIEGVSLRDRSYRGDPQPVLYETISILQELFESYNYGLVACRSMNGKDYEALLGWYDSSPARLELTPLGKRFVVLLGLKEIGLEDLDHLIEALSAG